MPITRVGIVYSANQKVIRRTHHFDRVADDTDPRGWRIMTQEELRNLDEDAEIAKHQPTHGAEKFVTIPHADYHALTSHQAVHDYLGLTGVPYVDDRHAVVDGDGNVIAVGCYDPAIDTHPNGKLVHHADAQVGDKIKAVP